ncbi:phage portal protein [Oerskovia jenensis]|uniref:phage portal protein n=1 Tax=Oerskovia jenensis TaxID=162169 RepID=UPI0036DC83F2
MPLPQPGQAWPPKALADITPVLSQWSAWYEGTPEALRGAYQSATTAPMDRPSQYRGGIVGALARGWWGRPLGDLTVQQRGQVHIPLAADIARGSADLLYAEPPTLVLADTAARTTGQASSKTQDRLNEYVDDGFHSVLATGAEVGAALGGRYQRVTWDRAAAGKPFLTTVDADAAWPEFRWGRLVGVTFWRVVETNGQTVRRHLERHELDPAGNGVVLHALFEGTSDNLGRAVPLTESGTTAALAPLVGMDGAITEGRTPGLLVEYIPNQLPQRRWRQHPVGHNLGRSDFDGVEPLMDALDETYSSLMRDIRLAKARIIVPSYMLDSAGPGRGVSFDLDREVYESVKAAPPEDGRLDITPHQFEIRVDEHLRACEDQALRIVQGAGYSTQTFAERTDGGQMTATEVHSRERRSYLTRDRKIRAERPAVARLAAKMLTIDQAVFRTTGLAPGAVSVDFGDTVQDAIITLAQTAQALEAARAASTETKVQMVHPDWTPEQVRIEVALINAQHSLTVTDPDAPPPGTESQAPAGEVDPVAVKAQADAMGVLIRAGVKSDDAAEAAGLDGVEFTGAVPTSLRLPEGDAAGLEGQ